MLGFSKKTKEIQVSGKWKMDFHNKKCETGKVDYL